MPGRECAGGRGHRRCHSVTCSHTSSRKFAVSISAQLHDGLRAAPVAFLWLLELREVMSLQRDSIRDATGLLSKDHKFRPRAVQRRLGRRRRPVEV
jgi:hypothetical protein